MTLILKNVKQSTMQVGRSLGYVFLEMTPDKEFNFVRRLQNADYPRFHMYIKEEGMNITINLHLDQKKPSYEGANHAHSGEYDGPLVEAEAEKIKQVVSR